MSPEPLLFERENDNSKTKEQLLSELAALREKLSEVTVAHDACEQKIGVLDSIVEPFLALDEGSRIIFANAGAEALFGAAEDGLAGKLLMDVYPKSKDTMFYHAFERAKSGHAPARFRETNRSAGKWFEVTMCPAQGGGMSILFRDITTSRHTDEIQRLALVLLHHLKENVFLMRGDGRLFHVNDETYSSLGYARDELKHMTIFDLVPQACLGEWHDILDKIRQQGSATFESKLRAKDGREVPVEVYANYIKLYGSDYYIVSARDITERKNAEKVLEKYRLFSENVRDIALFVRRDGRILEANHAAVKAYGYTREELLSLTVYDLRATDPGYHVDEQMDTAFDAGILFEALHLRKDGSTFPVEVSSQGRVIDGQKVMLSIVRDITERKRAEEALRESEESFRNLTENISDWVWEIDQEGRYNYASPRVQEMLGFAPDEVLGRTPFDFMAPQEAEKVTQVFRRIWASQEPFELLENRLIRKDGREVVLETSGLPVFDERGQFAGYRGVDRNITERKRDEEALRETRDYLESLINYANAPIIVWDPGFVITRFNHAFERLSGYSAGEVVGKDLRVLFPADSSEESMEKIGKTLAGEFWESVEIPIRHKDGGVRIALWNSANIHSESGSLLATIAQGQDITERKRAEEALRVAKAQAELYVDLMSHDINNMNQIGKGFLEMLLGYPGTDSHEREMLQKALESLDGSSQLIKNVQKLQLASADEAGLHAVDVAEVLRGNINELRSVPGKEVTIYYKNPVTPCPVTANELLRDVFSNLIGNAIKHSGPERHVTIGVAVETVEEGGKKFCRVAIDDNGPGIPDEVKARLFQRFSRGQTKAKGSGLGLYLVKTLVEHYGGQIRVEDRVPGDHTKGARLLVMLPVINE